MREQVTILMKRFAQMRDRIRGWVLGRTLHYLAMVDEPWYTWVNALANFYILMRNPERVTHPGNLHPDKTFYVIRDLPPTVGLAGWYDRVLGYMTRAERKGWIPVVDPPPPAQVNGGSWYDFFNGPSGHALAEVLESRNVVFASVHGVIHKRYSRRNIKRRNRLLKDIRLSDDACAFMEDHLPGTLPEAPVVGVVFRGTDYRCHGSYCPVGHAKVPSIDEFCDRIARDLDRWGLPSDGGSRLFVVTEEQEALDSIRSRFPSCRYVKKERYANFRFETTLPYLRLPNTTPKENNLLYLLDIYALSKCDYLVGGLTGAVLMALNLNGNRYKGVDIVKTGVN